MKNMLKITTGHKGFNLLMKKLSLVNIESVLEILASLSFLMIVLMKISLPVKDVLSLLEVVFGCIILLYHFSRYGISLGLLCILFLLLIACGLNYFFVGAITTVLFMKLFFVHLPIALVLVQNKRLHAKIWQFCFFFLSVFLMYRLYIAPDGIRIFADTSRNMISAFLITAACIYKVSLRCKQNKPDYAIVLTILFCSIAAKGRGGIVSAIVLLLLTLFVRYYLNNGKRKTRKWVLEVVIVSVALLALSFVIYINSSWLISEYLPRFSDSQFYSAGYSNEIRLFFLHTYFHGIMEIKSLLLGFNMIGTSWLATIAQGNIHNSYLQVHSYMGIIGLTIFLMSITVGLKHIIRKKDYYFAAFIITFLLRILTDYILPGNIGDIISWYFILLVVSKKKYIKVRCDED